MRIDIMTLFPEMFAGPLGYSIPKRAQEAGLVDIELTNIREFGLGNYKKVDDTPYGGGPGMVMMCEPVFNCFEHVEQLDPEPGRVLMMSPAGRKLDQKLVRELSGEKRLILLAGRYEGFDERIQQGLGAEPVSIGDYVLSGGELVAMVVVDSVVRLLEGALGHEESATEESFSEGLLEYPHYTRPVEYKGMRVPEVLMSGNHAKIELWRKEQALERTKKWRPDMLDDCDGTDEEV
ncbi:tRNA (guanine-N(1)-)-methyltransferase [Anaerohalosphaera lusitana]|uniref:tRNA (guanine-N(1)-)-methyltransferase n=1 Tax=Anaerohalosphaera lusitana TaxID=1936003 RepID=A0A1U9NPK8_9BACT|nr:tRNA (guanosine(37)-N1)-methyltransferase TrmD [Anaerohalosphaera lusitana]AQT69872.1 tRNA (guanine-N(1)-)-methyltransferase [Anaerohalosphaera lusitana]